MARGKIQSSRRRPKGDKRQRTRTALLEAARAVIRDKGHERTTLEEVARRAGMTTGAIYGNFKNRDDLFIELGHTYWAPVRPKIASGASFADAMRALASATLAAVGERAPAAVGRLKGMSYALQHARFQAQVQDVTRASYDAGAQWLRGFDPNDLPMPPDHLVRVLHALIEGLVMQRILTPALFSDEVFYQAFAAFAPRP